MTKYYAQSLPADVILKEGDHVYNAGNESCYEVRHNPVVDKWWLHHIMDNFDITSPCDYPTFHNMAVSLNWAN